MEYKVLLSDYEFEHLEYEEKVFKESGLSINFIKAQCKTEDEVIEHAKDVDAILNQYAPLGKRVIESLTKCKVISRYGVGVNTVDLDVAKDKDITVANVPDYGMEEVSNHTLALLLSWARKVTVLNNEVKMGNWDFKAGVPIHRFDNQTLGVLGFGRIPRRLIEKARPLGFKMAAYDPFVLESDMEKAGVQKMSLDQIIQVADFLSIHVPLTKDTYHLINKERLAKMKSNAIIINTARGPIIDEVSLADALSKGLIAGAALDVTEEEPVDKASPLINMDNVIITPHSAWYSEESMIELRTKAALNIVHVLKGELTPYALT